MRFNATERRISLIKIPKSHGYDILIWQRRVDSPTWCCGYTNGGEKFLQKLHPDYVQGALLDLSKIVFPMDFIRMVPKSLKVGAYSPKNDKVSRINGDPLH